MATEADVERMISEGDVNGLIETLLDDDMPIRAKAAGGLRSPEARTALLSMVDDPRSEMRAAVVNQLGIIAMGAVTSGNTTEVTAVVEALGDDEADVRIRAIRGLERLGWGETTSDVVSPVWDLAARPLLEFLGGGTTQEQAEAAKTLGSLAGCVDQIDDELRGEAVTNLWRLFESGDTKSRNAAMTGFVGFQVEEAIGPMIELLADADESVRFGAHSDLVSMGTPTVEPLIEALSHPQAFVAELAARSLGMMGDERALDPLRTAVRNSGHLWVRERATEAIEKLESGKT